MSNHLNKENSPYLLQHATNPVDWYPWGEEAFEKARQEEKPIFLSIGYSTCHWCHVMAHECFENTQIAMILNQFFISIKVDREERPDIDSVYMSVCQALTGNGGWPMSIFMTAEQKPFFAGTYFPPSSHSGMMGFTELLLIIADKWEHHRSELMASAKNILISIKNIQNNKIDSAQREDSFFIFCNKLTTLAAESFSQRFDSQYGGFGDAPKFPIPHNIIFLILYSQIYHNPTAWKQASVTLEKMRRGGIFDQIGYGFSRYSTDPYYLVPHFEKMLYDNALLILAYSAAYKVSGDLLFLDTAKKTADYILREMTNEDGAFYSAQDADSEGTEGKFYIWDKKEIFEILGEKKGKQFCEYFSITNQGNFEGKNIPNLLNGNKIFDNFEREKLSLYLYRKSRFCLHLDDKILTSWNSLMIAAMSILYQVTGNKSYLLAAESAYHFIEKHLTNGNLLFVSCRSQSDHTSNHSYTKEQTYSKPNTDKNMEQKKEYLHSVNGFLDDYAYYTAALLSLYQVTSIPKYLIRAEQVCKEAQHQFEDKEFGGYFLYGIENSSLITKPKETYDGALPSGNSMMAYCLVRLFHITGNESYKTALSQQFSFLSAEAEYNPTGHCLFLIALLFRFYPPQKITVVLSKEDTAETLISRLPLYADIKILSQSTNEYKLLNNKTTYYICKNHTCLPPTNQFPF